MIHESSWIQWTFHDKGSKGSPELWHIRRSSDIFGVGFHDHHDPRCLGTATAPTCEVNMFVILECRRPRLAWALAKVFGSHRTAEVLGVSFGFLICLIRRLWVPGFLMVPPCFHCGLSMSFTWSKAIPLWLMAGTDQDLRLRRPEDAGAPSRVKSSSRVAESQNPSQKPVWQSLDSLSENDTKFHKVPTLRVDIVFLRLIYEHDDECFLFAFPMCCMGFTIQPWKSSRVWRIEVALLHCAMLHGFASLHVLLSVIWYHKMSLDVTRRQKMSHKQNTLRRLWHFFDMFFECLAVWHWNFNIWFSDLASWKVLQVTTCNNC
jgi:hypothetical protein